MSLLTKSHTNSQLDISKLSVPLRLTPSLLNYAWGKPFASSVISKLANITDEVKDKGLPLAELWYGAHTKSPSLVCLKDAASPVVEIHLDELLARYPKELLGEETAQRFANQLPFLFKVLSINQPLSIQFHPDKASALELHNSSPENYPDTNHKPEIAIALTEMELVAGFKSYAEIEEVFNCFQISELLNFRNTSLLDKEDKSLVTADEHQNRLVVERIFALTSIQVSQHLRSIATACANPENISRFPELCFWLEKLPSIYGQDIGIIFFLMLNLLKLKPWEAVFIKENLPHAYLSGEALECMANSDNVIRLGLTPKTCDSESSLKLLDFRAALPDIFLLENRNSYLNGSKLETNKEVSSQINNQSTKLNHPLKQSPFTYPLKIADFAITELNLDNETYIFKNTSVALLFSLNLSGRLESPNFSASVNPGGAFLISNMLSYCHISGSGKIFIIKVP